VNSTVVVLQHPNEEKRSLATVPLLKACLPEDKCIVLKGRKFPSQKIPILTEVFKSKKSVLLYPSVDAEDLYSLPSWTDTCDVEEFRAIVVLDGTWNQARGLYAHNPDLKKMRKIKVSVKHESAYVIRTQPTKDSLCTLESVAYALSHLEDQPAIHHVLTEPLKLMCQYQINHGSSVHYSKDDSRYAQDKR
jgi:DTW domain-containing protein YfiP